MGEVRIQEVAGKVVWMGLLLLVRPHFVDQSNDSALHPTQSRLYFKYILLMQSYRGGPPLSSFMIKGSPFCLTCSKPFFLVILSNSDSENNIVKMNFTYAIAAAEQKAPFLFLVYNYTCITYPSIDPTF